MIIRKSLKIIGLASVVITILVLVYVFGYGLFVPYSLQPSYYDFKALCNLNALPDNKEKYNRILNVFDMDLESLNYKVLSEYLNNPKYRESKNTLTLFYERDNTQYYPYYTHRDSREITGAITYGSRFSYSFLYPKDEDRPYHIPETLLNKHSRIKAARITITFSEKEISKDSIIAMDMELLWGARRYYYSIDWYTPKRQEDMLSCAKLTRRG